MESFDNSQNYLDEKNAQISFAGDELFANSPTATICVSEPGEVLAANQASLNLLAISEKVILTKPLITLVNDDHRRSLNTFLYEIKSNIQCESELNMKTRAGHIFPALLIGRAMYKNDVYQYSIITIVDISQQKKIEQSLTTTQSELQHLAHHDPLTNLPNRYLLEDRLQNAMIRTKRNGWLGAIVFLDIDRFKVINDDYGHHVGDMVLKEVAQMLTSTVREQDTVCRYSGDEFILILEEITCEADAKHVIEKILHRFQKPVTNLIDQPLKITTSIGVCLFDKYDRDEETLLKKADYAMYESKRQGRNTYTFYCAEHSINQNLEMIIENDLSLAISNNEFELFFQPQYQTESEKIESIEVLTKWLHPKRGLLQPDEFIHRMENSNLSFQLTEWVMHEACRIAGDWYRSGYEFSRIAINVGPKEFATNKLVSLVKQALTEYHLPPEKLEIELTENSLLQNPNLAKKLMHEFQNMGIRLTLDDFGTGYSALSYLNEYPFDCIKIDKSFVDNLPFNRKSAALVDAMISIADSIGMDIIAEGVEHKNQKEYLEDKGCRIQQGFLFSTAINDNDMSDLLIKQAIKARRSSDIISLHQPLN